MQAAIGREHALEQRPELEEMQQGSALEEGQVLEAAVGREHALEQRPELKNALEEGQVLKVMVDIEHVLERWPETLLTNLNRIPLPYGTTAQQNTSKGIVRVCGSNAWCK